MRGYAWLALEQPQTSSYGNQFLTIQPVGLLHQIDPVGHPGCVRRDIKDGGRSGHRKLHRPCFLGGLLRILSFNVDFPDHTKFQGNREARTPAHIGIEEGILYFLARINTAPDSDKAGTRQQIKLRPEYGQRRPLSRLWGSREAPNAVLMTTAILCPDCLQKRLSFNPPRSIVIPSLLISAPDYNAVSGS
jgi:hypothetical protein